MELSNEFKQELLRTIDDGALNAEVERRKQWYNKPAAQAMFGEFHGPGGTSFRVGYEPGSGSAAAHLIIPSGYMWFRRDIEYLRNSLDTLLSVMPKE